MPSAQVFVSYSHLDRQWLDPKYKFDLIPWLAYSLRREGISFWYDRSDERGLQGGDRFQEEIERAIDSSQIALLLLSEAFFASDFIQEVELPRILECERQRQLVVMPILLEPCDWKSSYAVAAHHMLPGEPTPLIEFTQTDRDWSAARAQIVSAIRRRARELPPGGRLEPEEVGGPTTSTTQPARKKGPLPAPLFGRARFLALSFVAIIALASLALASRFGQARNPTSAAPTSPIVSGKVGGHELQAAAPSAPASAAQRQTLAEQTATPQPTESESTATARAIASEQTATPLARPSPAQPQTTTEQTATPQPTTSESTGQPDTATQATSNGVGLDISGTAILRDGSKESFIWFNAGEWGGTSFEVAGDMDGNNRRSLSLPDVKQIDILGSTTLEQNGQSVRNIWAEARITLRSGRVLQGYFLNLSGLEGHWEWCYRTEDFLVDVDGNASTIIFN